MASQALLPEADRTRRKGVAAFLVICFGASWAYVFTARFVCGLSLVNPLVQLPFGLMPAIAATVVRRWVTREGFADSGLRLRLRSAWPYYLLAWLGPLALTAATMGLAAALGLWTPDFTPLREFAGGMPAWAFIVVLMLVLPLLTPVYGGEEFGWTSYLRPRLSPGRSAKATVITGLIWASWHYPLAFVGYVEFSDVLIGLLAWTISFQFQEALLAWLYVRSGSVWVVSLAHAGNNMVLSLISGILLSEGAGLEATPVTLLMTAPMAVVCAVLALRGKRRPREGGMPGPVPQPAVRS
ncbi:CPBP family intramembrane metalloprotease [Streptomyces rectiverticillatus]|uniref:CPBP family intramembrane glutamic endopeptidase n=1 Tax=Streptomyces rectiverticillatus TaxID=173860 RepID=UPI0015C2CD4C|nr:CPBP family intramembrane glutamic endopeptidase [Streptomyces rectiverticillatus]QLE75163.1 CPBP family intramembrane metalloprotease [Streptomyces rectiverticillatus]